MYRFFFALFLLFTTQLLFAQSSLKGLSFHSDAERELFLKIEKGADIDYLEAIMIANEGTEAMDVLHAREKIAEVTSLVNRKKFNKKSKKKKAEMLYELVHDELLVKYEEEILVPELFSKGYYNCVSATAVYCLVFDAFDIEMMIVEKPAHVYAVAFPGEDGVVIESTDPQNGSNSISKREKEKIIQRLINSKLIDVNEYKNKTIDQIYSSIASETNTVIDFQKLLAIVYGNQSYYAVYDDKDDEAFKHIKKAHWLYPESKQYAAELNRQRSIWLNKNAENLDSLYLVEFEIWMNDSLNEVTEEIVNSVYENIKAQYALNTEKKELYPKRYTELYSSIKDTLIQKELAYMYCADMASLSFGQFDLDESLNYADSALIIKPTSVVATNLLLQGIAAKMESTESGELVMDMLLHYENRHKRALENNGILLQLKGLVRLYLAYEHFKNKEIRNGLDQLKFFESIMSETENEFAESELVGLVYGEVVSYYFKIGNKAKAKEFVNKGLTYAPYSQELKTRYTILY